MNRKIRVISCILTVAVMALIFFFSSQNSGESSEVSSGVTEMIIRFFIGDSAVNGHAELIGKLEFFVRKTAHFTLYALLGLTSSFAVRANGRKAALKIFAAAVIFSMLYAVSDELHQLFVGGRAARATDVFIDTCGAAAGAGVFAALRWLLGSAGIKFDGWITFTVIIMAAVFMFSAQTSEKSNDLSHAVTEGIVNIASPVIEPVVGEDHLSADELNSKVRKAAHFTLYFLLGLVMTATIVKKGRIRVHNAFLIAFLLSMMYAAGDEFHQSFVEGRGALASDVLIDSCGAAAGAIVCTLLLRVFRKKRGTAALIKR